MGWFFRRKKGGRLMTPDPAPGGIPANMPMSYITGGNIRVDVGQPKNERMLARSISRIEELTKLKERVERRFLDNKMSKEQRDNQMENIEIEIKHWTMQYNWSENEIKRVGRQT